MTAKRKPYIPGTYAKRTPSGQQIAEQAVLEWEKKRLSAIKKKAAKARVTNCIAFSRKIGVGALEIADRVSEKLDGMQVIDREILEQIAGSHQLGEKTVDSFDERYPGTMREFFSLLFGEKSFTHGDYLRYLAGAVYALADAEATIFVGRAAHLILPRERVMAIRFIASREFRIKRVAGILEVTEDAAAREIDRVDGEQRDFFRKNFNKKDASPYEFDMVINRDYLQDAKAAAEIVTAAYTEKFGKSGS
ncbi:MAG: cytidylate kinase-like family protein [Desulfobacteraceae bacterium]|nr:cytidylate kinase-like family protein [Desulfobacteraceae bacterium]